LSDLSDGQLLARLLEGKTKEEKKVSCFNVFYVLSKLSSGLQRIQMMSQASDVLKWLEQTLKVDLKRCSPEDLIDKKDKSVFGLLFSVILKFVKLEDEDAEVSGGDVREALKLWFSKRTAGYNGVEIKDLKSRYLFYLSFFLSCC
jgi:hypothetical protein